MLAATHLIGFGGRRAAGGGSPTVQIDYTGKSSVSGISSATWAPTGIGFGTPQADRYVYVAGSVVCNTNLAALDLTGLRIGGVPGGVFRVSQQGENLTFISGALVPAGASGQVVIDVTPAYRILRGVVHAYSVVNLLALAETDGASVPLSGGAGNGASIDVQAGGGFIAAQAIALETSPITWLGLTQDTDTTTTGFRMASAHLESAAALTGYAFSTSFAASLNNLVAMAFR